MPRIPVSAATATHVTVQGRKLLAFGGCNYLGLAHHPSVHEAVRTGLAAFGISTTASRETTGDTTVHDALEHELADFLGTQACLVTPEGYTANLALAQALAREHQVALVDEKSHRSVAHAVHAAGMMVNFYRHLDMDHARRLVEQHRGAGIAILTDGVFAADGAVAPVDELIRLTPREGATLVIDDCHGFCVLGRGGRGTCDQFLRQTPLDARIVITTSLAKGLGCYGGAIAGRRGIVDLAMDGSSVYRGTTPAPTPLVWAAREALRVMRREPGLVDHLRQATERMRVGLEGLGVKLAKPPTPESDLVPIFCFVLEPQARMREVAGAIERAGFLAPLISYPGGPGPEFFRLTVSAAHSAEQVDALVAEFAKHVGAHDPFGYTSRADSAPAFSRAAG